MCKLHDKLDLTSYTGYKMVVKRNGKYYSPCTGIEYKPGKVHVVKVTKENHTKGRYVIKRFAVKPLTYIAYQKLMVGKTAVFCKKQDCIDDMNYIRATGKRLGFDMVVIKMAIGGEIWDGSSYDESPVYAGTEILKVERVSK